MTISKRIAVLALAWLSVPLWGTPVSIDRARQVANGFLLNEQVQPSCSVRKVHAAPRRLMTDQRFYVFDTEDGGYHHLCG